MSAERPDGILMVSDILTTLNRKRVFEFAAANKIPAIYEVDLFARDGGLMSYGAERGEAAERAADLIDRILKGAKPADLPIERPAHIKFVINLKTAKELGITLPPTLLILADEVIE
jgi:putative tryptophan/tyrosine transport system substrate-binding protein